MVLVILMSNLFSMVLQGVRPNDALAQVGVWPIAAFPLMTEEYSQFINDRDFKQSTNSSTSIDGVEDPSYAQVLEHAPIVVVATLEDEGADSPLNSISNSIDVQIRATIFPMTLMIKGQTK